MENLNTNDFDILSPDKPGSSGGGKMQQSMIPKNVKPYKPTSEEGGKSSDDEIDSEGSGENNDNKDKESNTGKEKPEGGKEKEDTKKDRSAEEIQKDIDKRIFEKNAQSQIGKGGGPGTILSPEQSRNAQKAMGVPYEKSEWTEEKVKKKIEDELNSPTIDIPKGSQDYGKGVGSLRKALAKIARPQVNWRKELRRFIGTAPSPDPEDILGHRSFIHSGKYIWSDRPKETGELGSCVCAVDVSGSMSDDNVATILTEIKGIVESRQIQTTTIVYFHSEIEKVVTLQEPGAVAAYQGHKVKTGGTDFFPPLAYMTDLYKKGKLELGVFLTDGYADLNLTKPRFINEFVWVILDNPAFIPPWGSKVIYINQDSKGRI